MYLRFHVSAFSLGLRWVCAFSHRPVRACFFKWLPVEGGCFVVCWEASIIQDSTEVVLETGSTALWLCTFPSTRQFWPWLNGQSIRKKCVCTDAWVVVSVRVWVWVSGCAYVGVGERETMSPQSVWLILDFLQHPTQNALWWKEVKGNKGHLLKNEDEWKKPIPFTSGGPYSKQLGFQELLISYI